MKLKMSGWKKIHDAEDHAIMRNDNGHELKIMKGALNPKLLEQLSGISGQSDEKKSSKKEPARKNYYQGSIVDGSPADPEVVSQPEVIPEPDESALAPAIPGEMLSGADRLKSLAAPDAVEFQDDQSKYLDRIAVADAGKLRGSERLDALEDPNALQLPTAEVAPATEAPEAAAPLAQAPAAAPEAAKPSAGQEAQQVASAVKTLSDVAQTVQDKQKLQEDAITDYNSKFEELNVERNNIMDDINSGHIDPNRFWSSQTTGQKMNNIIGLVMGGIGQGYVGGDNPAMKLIESSIDRDIKSQQAEMDKKNNLLTANMKQFGNLKEATDMTRAMQMDIVSNQLKLEASKTDNLNAKTNALKVSAEIKFKADELHQKAASAILSRDAESALKKDPSNADAYFAKIELSDPKKAADLRERFIPGWGLAQTKTDATTLKDGIAIKKNFDENIDAMIELRKKYEGGTFFEPDDISRGTQLSNKALLAYKDMSKLGILSAMDTKILNAIIPPDPLTLRGPVAVARGQDPVLTKLEKFKQDSDKDFKTNLGLRLSGGQQSAEQALEAHSKINQLPPNQKAIAEWAKKNPNDPRAKKALRALGLE